MNSQDLSQNVNKDKNSKIIHNQVTKKSNTRSITPNQVSNSNDSSPFN